MKDTKSTKSVKDKNTATKIEELQEKIRQLALTIDKVEDEKQEIINQLKRALADYHNLEANIQKRLNTILFQSKKTLAESLIVVVDDLTMAMKSKEEIEFDEKSESWANGIAEVFKNLEKGLEEIGLKKYIPEKGSKYDSSLHEALSVVESKTPGVIYDVIQPGYMLDEIVIRPSRVVVTKSK